MSNQMIIKVVAVEIVGAKTKTGKDYEYLDVMFKNLTFEGKAESKKIMPFGSKEVFATLKAATSGQVFTVLRTKDDAGYWQWDGIAAGEQQIEVATTGTKTMAQPATAAPKSNFETAEERAKRQMLIVRQSAISSAVAFLSHNNKNYKLQDVLDTANAFYEYVFQTGVKVPTATLPEIDDEDIPM